MKRIFVVLALFIAALALHAQQAPTDGKVEFSVATRRTSAKYAPRHVLAIWVSDSKGNFVKSLKVAAAKRGRYLQIWNANSGGNKVDAVTSATLRDHETHAVTWDCRDSKGNLVPDGDYRIHVEFTEQNGKGPITPENHIRFTKGPKPATLAFPNLQNFGRITLSYTPGAGKTDETKAPVQGNPQPPAPLTPAPPRNQPQRR